MGVSVEHQPKITPFSPLASLQQGHWFKLICGASFQDLAAIRSLALAYGLAGIDCVDVAADPAVMAIARQGLDMAEQLAPKGRKRGYGGRGRPWLMVSLNDGEDPHFRKAFFDPQRCPTDCDRPCEKICPALAIDGHGVTTAKCYGCGRCFPICPWGLIEAENYVYSPGEIVAQLLPETFDAIEIHTQVGHGDRFQTLWHHLQPLLPRLKAIAISCQDHPQVLAYLRSLWEMMTPLPCPLIWQTDGRPMSGDLGKGTIHATIRFAQKVMAADLPGFVQLAGGTNQHTVPKLHDLQLLHRSDPPGTVVNPGIAGIAYGSYGRSLLQPLLQLLETPKGHNGSNPGQLLEANPSLLWQSVEKAFSLVAPLKYPAFPISDP